MVTEEIKLNAIIIRQKKEIDYLKNLLVLKGEENEVLSKWINDSTFNLRK